MHEREATHALAVEDDAAVARQRAPPMTAYSGVPHPAATTITSASALRTNDEVDEPSRHEHHLDDVLAVDPRLDRIERARLRLDGVLARLRLRLELPAQLAVDLHRIGDALFRRRRLVPRRPRVRHQH